MSNVAKEKRMRKMNNMVECLKEVGRSIVCFSNL